MRDSIPRVQSKDDIDTSDVDDFPSLSFVEKTLVLLDQVREQYGHISMDDVCTAELHSMWWAIVRRRKLASIHSARSYKKEHTLTKDTSGKSLARRGVEDADAAREWFAKCGIPVMEAIV